MQDSKLTNKIIEKLENKRKALREKVLIMMLGSNCIIIETFDYDDSF